MTSPWNAGLLEPISAEEPCGKSLEDSGELALLEAYQLFGQDSLGEAPKPKKKEDAAEAPRREPRKSDRPPNWAEIEELTLDCLHKSKDLRALAHLGATVLRTRSVLEFVAVLGIASQWLEAYWASLYPLVDEDAVLRTNALSAFADRAAIIDGLRRSPLVSGPMGRVSMRDLDAAKSPKASDDDDPTLDNSAIAAALAAKPVEDLRALHAAAIEGASTLRAIDQTVRAQAGVESSPALDPLVVQLEALASMLKTRVAEHPAAVAADQEGGDAAAAGGGPLGSVRSRQDAIRALDAVAEFFRKSEPSSPVPLIVDRAKRLVSKDFLEVLADLAPGGLSEAKSASGIRE
jgi:type VI secretion system protein ImpA